MSETKPQGVTVNTPGSADEVRVGIVGDNLSLYLAVADPIYTKSKAVAHIEPQDARVVAAALIEWADRLEAARATSR